MSRILRRPMFRGGRVDARGTGITSNLGYNNGGRVGYGNGGVSTTGGFKRSPIGKGLGWLQDYFAGPAVNQFSRNYIRPFSGLFGYGDWPPTEQTPFNTTKEEWQEISGEKQAPIITDSEAIPKAIQQQEEAIKKEELESNNLTGGDGLPEKTKAEKLEEYQAMFEEAYGTGRGEDISNMLLSFAGKALKPEATVKSSFGEFFEEEAKRPSESKKYKDAATTAAINAFLTGEKTMAETESFMNRTDYTNAQKLALADKVQRGYSMNDFVLNRERGETKSEALEGGARKKVDFGQYKDFKKIKSKNNDEKLIDREYVGVIFMDEGTREVFTIIIGEDGKPAKQILYGV